MDLKEYSSYVNQLSQAKTVDDIQKLAPTGFSTLAGLKDWESRRAEKLKSLAEQGAQPAYPALVDYAQKTGTTDPRFFNDPESRAVLAQEGASSDIGPFAKDSADPTVAAVMNGYKAQAQNEADTRDLLAGEASPNVLARIATSDATKQHVAALRGLASDYQSQFEGPSLEERKYQDTKASEQNKADFLKAIAGVGGAYREAQPIRDGVTPAGPNVANGVDYSDTAGNPTPNYLMPFDKAKDLILQAASDYRQDPKDALAELTKQYETSYTDANGLPSPLNWMGKEASQTKEQLYARAQRGDKDAQAILAKMQADELALAKGKRDVGVQNPIPSGNLNINGLNVEEQAALNRALSNGLDPYKVNSRTAKIYAQQEMLNPGRKWNDMAAEAAFNRNAGVMNTKALLNTIDPLLNKLVEAGRVLGNGNITIINKAKNIYKEATGDPNIVGFNNLRDDVVAEVERGLLGSGVLSDSKYNRAIKNINSAQSLPQLKAAVENTRKVIAARLESLAAGPNAGKTAPAKVDSRPIAPAGTRANVGGKIVTSDGKGGWN